MSIQHLDFIRTTLKQHIYFDKPFLPNKNLCIIIMRNTIEYCSIYSYFFSMDFNIVFQSIEFGNESYMNWMNNEKTFINLIWKIVSVLINEVVNCQAHFSF